MSFIIGIRRREWAQMTLYSLIFSTLAYLIVLKFFPYFFGLLEVRAGTDKFGIQVALNEVSNLGTSLGTSKGKIAFHNIVKLVIIVTPISMILGLIVGGLRRSRLFRAGTLKYAHRTQNSDIWVDYHEKYATGPHMVYLKDGNMYFGQILMASDTLIGGDRGVIIQQPCLFENYNSSAFKGHSPAMIRMPGDVLVFSEQIASISNNLNPQVLSALRAAQPPGRLKTLTARIKAIFIKPQTP
jgi:hypothetical protein